MTTEPQTFVPKYRFGTCSAFVPFQTRRGIDHPRYSGLVRLLAFVHSRPRKIGTEKNSSCSCEQTGPVHLRLLAWMNTKKRNPLSAASSQELADSTSDLNAPVGEPRGKSKSTQSPGLSLLTDFPMPDILKTSGIAARRTFHRSIASLPASRARTSARPAVARPGWAFPAREAGSSARQFASSMSFNPAGWCLKTSRHCSIRKIAQTSRQSSHRLPSAGIWDSGECLMLNISEAPAAVVGFSWSQVLDDTPALTSWLTPTQWTQYLARVSRSSSHGGRASGLGILYSPLRPHHKSLSAVSLLLLTRTDGIRWLSGPERLRIMGFASDWMRPTLQRLGVPETPSPRRSRSGSARSSSAVKRQPLGVR